jgi:hypothetical protein
MTWLKASDPLALLAIQAGQVQNPSQQNGAVGGGSLDTDQRAISIGEPVPIVFARRRDNAGGVLISPGATEARFENDTSNNVTAFYLLPLSEGRMDSIQVRDVFQRACRTGTFTQTYNRRAGTWQPGNFIQPIDIADYQFTLDPFSAGEENRTWYDATKVGNIWKLILNGETLTVGLGAGQVKGIRNTTGIDYQIPEASYICGSIGLYPDITTLSFQVTIPDGFDQWRRQVHLFIRGGMWVTRLADNVLGPSDNFSDLARWMLLNSGRVPSALLDTTAFTSAAQFLEANQFRCNIWIQEAENFGDFISKISPYFLLGQTNNGGKKGLRPLLPFNNDGTINTGSIEWSYIFTENEILPGTLEIEYTNYADRQPFVAQMIWRQELEDDAAIIRTAEVRFINTAEVGPYESHDLSQFCTSEAHAVKVGAYILSRRVFVSHTVRFAARPQAHNRLLSPGSIIRVKLGRNASGGGASEHDYLYQVERIGKTLAGDVSYECSHFPIDNQNRSIVALNVANATGTGILLSNNSTGVSCDLNSSTSTAVPAESFITPGSGFDLGGLDTGTEVATDAGLETVIDNIDLADFGSGASGGSGSFAGISCFGVVSCKTGSGDNPSDGGDATSLGPFITEPVPGGPPGVPPPGICEGAVITRFIANIGDEANGITEVVDDYTFPLTPPDELGGDNYNGKSIIFRTRCPNGEEQVIDPITPGLATPCALDMVWPTGTWNPNGANNYVYTVTSRVLHNYPNCEPLDVQDSITTVFANAGEVVWHTIPDFKIGPCEGVIQYSDIRIFKTLISELCVNTSVLWDFARTGGLRSFGLSVTVSPAAGPGPDVEPYPTREEFAARYLT